MHSVFRYWMSDWPLWLFLYFNTQFQVSQMHPLSIPVLMRWSTTLIIPAFQYWFPCQPNLCIHVRYWMSDWPLWLFLYFNTEFQVSQMCAFTIQILVGWSATLNISAFQYWVLCQPNLCIHWLDIGWVIGHYDYSCISILSAKSAKCIHSASKYWLVDQLLWLFLHSNIGFSVSLIYAFTV